MTESTPAPPVPSDLPIAAGDAQRATLVALENLKAALAALEALVMALARAVDAMAPPRAGSGP